MYAKKKMHKNSPVPSPPQLQLPVWKKGLIKAADLFIMFGNLSTPLLFV